MRRYHLIARVGKRGEPVARVCTISTDHDQNPIKVARANGLASGRGYKAFEMSPEGYARDLNGLCPIHFFL